MSDGRSPNGASKRGSRKSTRSLVGTVIPQLRHPGNVVGPRASRTIGTILDATRQIFLMRGYSGTTIDEIARLAGVSRGSFYTYFPSKRDVLLALGGNSLHSGRVLVDKLGEFPADWRLEDLETWVGEYFDLLDEHGAFAFAWTQAAHEDEEIRRAGKQAHLELCRRMGQVLARLHKRPSKDPTESGLLAFSMLERGWAYFQIYEDTIDRGNLQRAMARLLAASTETT